jgi:hypothetical protein
VCYVLEHLALVGAEEITAICSMFDYYDTRGAGELWIDERDMRVRMGRAAAVAGSYYGTHHYATTADGLALVVNYFSRNAGGRVPRV